MKARPLGGERCQTGAAETGADAADAAADSSSGMGRFSWCLAMDSQTREKAVVAPKFAGKAFPRCSTCSASCCVAVCVSCLVAQARRWFGTKHQPGHPGLDPHSKEISDGHRRAQPCITLPPPGLLAGISGGGTRKPASRRNLPSLTSCVPSLSSRSTVSLGLGTGRCGRWWQHPPCWRGDPVGAGRIWGTRGARWGLRGAAEARGG